MLTVFFCIYFFKPELYFMMQIIWNISVLHVFLLYCLCLKLHFSISHAGQLNLEFMKVKKMFLSDLVCGIRYLHQYPLKRTFRQISVTFLLLYCIVVTFIQINVNTKCTDKTTNQQGSSKKSAKSIKLKPTVINKTMFHRISWSTTSEVYEHIINAILKYCMHYKVNGSLIAS